MQNYLHIQSCKKVRLQKDIQQILKQQLTHIYNSLNII